jgi:hypothetical protein
MGYLAPGAEAISEFARQHSGRWLTGTCVEASALMCAIALDPGRFQVAPGDVGDTLQQMVNDWRASDPNVSTNGASNYADAANWLRGQGLQAIDNLGVAGDWYGELQRGIPAGNVYLVGVTNAQALPGDEAGVHNHGLCAFGVDDAGNIVCGDPDNWRANAHMPGNPVGLSVTYGKQDFINGQISSLTKVWGRMGTPLDGYFNISADGKTYALKSDAVITLSGGELALYLKLNAAIGLPKEPTNYALQGQYYTGFCYRHYERAIVVYDPQHKLDAEPGLGDFYLAHIDSGPFAAAAAPSEDEAGEAAQLAALQQQVAALQAELAQAQQGITSASAATQAIHALADALATDDKAP